MLNFIKKYIFYKVSKEEKEYSRKRVMEGDHKSFCIVLISIFIFQVLMIITSFIRYGFNISDYALKQKGYLISYFSLAVVIIIVLLLLQTFFRKKMFNVYFVFVSLVMAAIYCWGISISVFDSIGKTNLTTIGYVMLAMIAFLTLEPWVTIMNLGITLTLLAVMLSVVPGCKLTTGSIITILSIFILGSMAAVFCFYRRMKAIEYETEYLKLNNELNKKAYFDDLTKVYSRRYLSEHIDSPLNIGAAPSGIMIFDIDDFKKVNDMYGHLNGDRCLVELGNIINEFMKDKNGYAVRYGGEEFLIYISNISDEELFEKAHELRKAVAEKDIILIDNSTIRYTISIGIASAVGGISYSGLVNQADNALYKSKAAGKNTVSR